MLKLAVLCLLALFTVVPGAFEVDSSSGLAGVSSQTDKKAAILTPQEVFKRVSPSVFIVEALNSRGEIIAFGSGVAVGSGQIVTNKHVVDEGIRLRIRRGPSEWFATVTHAAADYDLCRLQVEGLKVTGLPVRESSTLEIGERVYAIGAPKGLELTFSEGIISALRDFPNGRVIQTSAPISSGSSGGGLFDSQGRLIGITTATLLEGQNLNFAVPGEWILALEKNPVSTGQKRQGEGVAYEAMRWALRGQDYIMEGRYERAVHALREAVRLKPDLARVGWHNLGVAYLSLGQHRQALEALQEAIRVEPNVGHTWYNVAICHQRLHNHEKAIEAYREAIRLQPDLAVAWHGLGLVYGQLRTPASTVGIQKEIEAYLEAIRLKPEFPEAWHDLGFVYMELGQNPRAIEALREAIRLKPDWTRAWYSLGVVYRLDGNRAMVMEVYQKLKLLDGDEANDFFNKFVRP